jgi:hypothetical protein
MKSLKKFMLFLWCPTLLFSVNVDEIDYQFLLYSNPVTDHVQHFKKLFEAANISSMIEFGVGYGTKYFLDNCGRVASCEIVLPNQSDQWFKDTVVLFQKYSNWTPILKYGSVAMQKANEISIQGQIPALQDTIYLVEMKGLCNELFSSQEYELAFVDPGFHMRADLVTELFGRVPIIAAHDTSTSSEIYGWNRIITPSNYEKFTFFKGRGVTFWIRNDRPDVIAALKRHSSTE